MGKGIDRKDKRLLCELSRDSNISHAQLAKRVGLSKSNVAYRIAKLRENGVITRFTSVINLEAAGIWTFALLLKFNDDVTDILPYFRNHPCVDWLATLSGNWDVFAEFAFRDIRQLTNIIDEIQTTFEQRLNTYEFFLSSHIVKVEHLASDFCREFAPAQAPRARQRVQIDDTDRKLLGELSRDSSRSCLALANAIGTTGSIVRYRRKKLIDQGVILRLFADVSLPALGYTEYLCRLRLRNVKSDLLERLCAFLAEHSNITYCFSDATSSSVVFFCAFRSPGEIDALSTSLRKQHADMIEDQTYLILRENVFFNLFPRGLV